MTAIPGPNIKWAQWIRVARNYQLRVGHKDQKDQNGKDTKPKDMKKNTFDGFIREVRLCNTSLAYSVSVKTISWGIVV